PRRPRDPSPLPDRPGRSAVPGGPVAVRRTERYSAPVALAHPRRPPLAAAVTTSAHRPAGLRAPAGPGSRARRAGVLAGWTPRGSRPADHGAGSSPGEVVHSG